MCCILPATVSAFRAKWQQDSEEKADFMLLGPEFGQEPWLSPLRVVGACLASSSDTGPPGAEAGENGKNKSGKTRSSPSLSLTRKAPFLDHWSERGFSWKASCHHWCRVGLTFELLLQAVWYYLSSEYSDSCPIMFCPAPFVTFNGWDRSECTYSIPAMTGAQFSLLSCFIPTGFSELHDNRTFNTSEHRFVFVTSHLCLNVVAKGYVRGTRPA